MVVALSEQFVVCRTAGKSCQHAAGHNTLPHLCCALLCKQRAQLCSAGLEGVCTQTGQTAIGLIGQDAQCFIRVIFVEKFRHIQSGRAKHHQALDLARKNGSVQIIAAGLAQHGIDKAGGAGFFKGAGQLDRLVHRSRDRHLHIACLCQCSAQNLPHGGIQLCQPLGQKLLQNIVQRAAMLQHSVENGTCKSLIPAFQLLALELCVQHQIGKTVLLLPYQCGDCRRTRICGHQRLSPVFRRRPAAKAVPSMGFLPSGTTSSSWIAPSLQATVRGFVPSTVPGASP